MSAVPNLQNIQGSSLPEHLEDCQVCQVTLSAHCSFSFVYRTRFSTRILVHLQLQIFPHLPDWIKVYNPGGFWTMTLSFSIDLVLLFLCIPFPSTAAPNSLSDIQVGFENFLTAFYDGKGGWDWRRFAWNYIRRWHPATQQFWPDTCPCTSGKPKDAMARRRSWVQMVQDFS